MKKKNDNLYIYSTKTPWRFVLVVILYVIGASSFPTGIFSFIPGNAKEVELISVFLSRTICSILPIWLMFEIKTDSLFSMKGCLGRLLMLLPFFVVAINNFPFFPLFSGEAWFTNEITPFGYAWYILSCLGGVVLEETAFRGLVFPTIFRLYRDKKHGLFISVFVSSALFGLTHIVNLLGGSSIGSVIMQIGYSFLIGGMCAIAEYFGGSVVYAILLHFIFNIGGLLLMRGVVGGDIWNALTITLTAVIAVSVTIYAILLVLKAQNKTIFLEKIDHNITD